MSRCPVLRVTEVMDPDSDLVERLKAGDPAAFDAVYAAYHARLFNFLVRLSRNRQVAEDLVEETWVRLVSRAGRLRPDTQLAAWLFTVARNLYLSYCRSRLVEESHVPALMGLWPAGASRPSPFEATAASEFERRIEAGLARTQCEECPDHQPGADEEHGAERQLRHHQRPP